MTPREGVERICDESAAWWRAKAEDPSLPHDVRMFAIARASGAMEVKDALPAATAREEAWKAMVAYIECEDAYKNASKSNDWMAPLTAAGWDGKSNPRPLINRLRTRALALARSTGGAS